MNRKEITNSNELYELTKDFNSKEDCERVIKENIINTIHSYWNVFMGTLLKNKETLTEDELFEIKLAVKYFCRIEEVTSPKEHIPLT